MSPDIAPAAPPPPAAGSPRYFVLLYTPAPRRAALQVLLAIADELAAGLARELDHGVAHLRLAWWADELTRLAQTAPRHPWLLSLPGLTGVWPDLRPLAEAATLDLATHRLAARHDQQLAAALFTAAAELLGLPAQALSGHASGADVTLCDDLQLLGRSVHTLEAAVAGASWAASQATQDMAQLQERQRRGPLPASTRQAMLAPLLVWVALAVHRWHRQWRQRGPAGSDTSHPVAKSATMLPFAPGRFDGLADNYIAWRTARRALRARFRIPNP